MKYSGEESRKPSHLASGTAGKWLVLGVLLTGAVRILMVLFWGGSVGDVLGTTAVGLALAMLIWIILGVTQNRKIPPN